MGNACLLYTSPLLDGFIRQEQFCFRREHSTNLQLVKVVTQLTDAENKHQSTVTILLDVSSSSIDRIFATSSLGYVSMGRTHPLNRSPQAFLKDLSLCVPSVHERSACTAWSHSIPLGG